MDRLVWADIAKGLGIFLMVFGHSGVSEFMHNWIYSFHMPFFFVLSGYFFVERKYSFIELINKKIRTIILPYIFFTVFIEIVRFLCCYTQIKVPPPESVFDIIFWGKDIGATWFLYVLFVTEIVFYLIRIAFRNNLLLVVLLISVSFMSYWFYHNNTHFPYKLEVCGMTLLYYGIGLQLARMNDKYGLIKNYIHRYWEAIVFFLLIILDLVLANVVKPPLNIRINRLGIYLPSLLLIISGTLLVIQMAFVLEKIGIINRFFKYIGEYSIVLIGFSQIVLQLLKGCFEVIHFNGPISIVCRYIVLWGVLLILIRMISVHCPIVIGKKKQVAITRE